MKTDDLTSFEVGSDDPVEVLYCFNPLDYGFYLDNVSRKKLLQLYGTGR